MLPKKMNAITKTRKPTKCKAVHDGVRCRNTFQARNMNHRACSPECAKVIMEADKEKDAARIAKASRAATRQAIKAAKTRAWWIKEAQKAVNAYVRARDTAAGLPCVSCGRHHQGQNHAGHYMPTSTRPGLRFNLDNIHLQCSPCNMHKHGNLVQYRPELIRRIGLVRVEWLEKEHPPAKWLIPELEKMARTYRRLAREILKGSA